MGASLMFGTTFLIKYGINILQDPLTNGLMNKPVSTSSDVPTDGDIASKYKIHSSLEENESTSFLSSIYSFILDYVSSTSGSINRFPLDVGVNDCFTGPYYFVNLNLLVYIMFMAVLYFSICNVAFLSLTYIQAKLKYWFPKTTLFSGKDAVENREPSKNIEFITWLLKNLIVINKVLILFLFIIILISSTYLYFNYSFSSDLVNHYNNTMKELHGLSYDYTIVYKSLDVHVHYTQKFSEFVLVAIISIYRVYFLLRPLECNKHIKLVIGLVISFIMRQTVIFIISITLVGDIEVGATFAEIFNGYNLNIKLVFYSLLIFIFFFTIEYIIFNNKSKFNTLKDNSQYNCRSAIKMEPALGNFDSKNLFYNILFIILKLTTSLAFFSVFEGSYYLFSYYIPANVYTVCSLIR